MLSDATRRCDHFEYPVSAGHGVRCVKDPGHDKGHAFSYADQFHIELSAKVGWLPAAAVEGEATP